MFNNEISRIFSGLKVIWYPQEEICLVIKENSIRTYGKIPKKYVILFDNKDKAKTDKLTVRR